MEGHVKGRERYVFSICLVCAISELILAIVVYISLFPFDRFYKLLQFSSDIPVHVFRKCLKGN